jgi:fatty-acyl-CoA synthase
VRAYAEASIDYYIGARPRYRDHLVLEGLMQNDFPLTLAHVLGRMRTVNADAEVVTLGDDGKRRTNYGDVVARVDRLAGALGGLGIEDGDRVATFCWNTQAHLECYLAIPSVGAVLHTLNIRLFADQLAYIVNHAKDRVIFVDDSLVPLLEPVAERFETVEKYVVIGDGSAGSLEPVVRYEELLASAEPLAEGDYPELSERAAAAMCYTSGTTGNPKGVLYSHRSAVLHSLATGMVDSLGVNRRDRILPVVPMFHANAWGLAYAAAMYGASLIMPNRFLQAEPLVSLIESEKVTFAGAVPTIWLDVLRYADEHGSDLSSLRSVVCGGSAVPRSLMEAFEARHGVEITQAWGMTETSPLGSIAHPPAGAEGEERWEFKATAGRVAPFVEARVVGADGSVLPCDGETTGELEVRGPWIAAGYYEDPVGSRDRFNDGWLRTGDIASIDATGYIRISDRAKDVIKSGGEWISSVELENELIAHPAVREAAVIAMPDERWSERPLACVVLEDDAEATPVDLREHLAQRVAKWWLPDSFAFIKEVPKTSVGKFDKKVLRSQLADGGLSVVEVEKPVAR